MQHYAWGTTDFIPKLLGTEITGEPCAELWLGTHPNGPSTFADGTALSDISGNLPYLLKVLSAAQPLSLQAHPTTAQALDGFERGVYGDASAKPELFVALTPFEALCGVRPEDRTVELLRSVGADQLADVVAVDGAGKALRGLYLGDLDPAPVIEACRTSERPEAAWVGRLDAMYPGDPSVAVTLLLNFVQLLPGEALRLTAGNLHAYLHGSGIELMQASDNVVRGGLTVKDVDLDELLRVVDATPLPEPVIQVVDGRYPLPEAGVQLVWIDPDEPYTAVGHELAVALDGELLYLSPGTEFIATADTFVVTPL